MILIFDFTTWCVALSHGPRSGGDVAEKFGCVEANYGFVRQWIGHERWYGDYRLHTSLPCRQARSLVWFCLNHSTKVHSIVCVATHFRSLVWIYSVLLNSSYTIVTRAGVYYGFGDVCLLLCFLFFTRHQWCVDGVFSRYFLELLLPVSVSRQTGQPDLCHMVVSRAFG